MAINYKQLLSVATQAALEPLRIGDDQTAFIPFTGDLEQIKTHYCNEPELRGYVECVGSECPLCRAGKKAENRYLLPVYVPIERRVGIVNASESRRPGALLPQLVEYLGEVDKGHRILLFAHKKDLNFTVSMSPLPEDVDDGDKIIKQFMDDVAAGTVDVKSVVQHLTAQQLAAVPTIAQMLKLKGVNL